jgi:hypothetical protein
MRYPACTSKATMERSDRTELSYRRFRRRGGHGSLIAGRMTSPPLTLFVPAGSRTCQVSVLSGVGLTSAHDGVRSAGVVMLSSDI